ncbi:hypothetical protein AURDEDRAFT_131324 [Auricularia subglabra TFB-10046 SS5]|uniref:Uncharacterized protein n=1 Tax=Auricularia subglabra (strain TFB-10046 / SS5) TaxID=717982 RepID=J0WNZ9_AURST|nr:hypothetical protein AURDEDRAFT_131324 [Auricularia subglabra TFB-10046 SS5]
MPLPPPAQCPPPASVLLSATLAIDESAIDASDAEYAAAFASATSLASDFPASEHFTEHSHHIANVDVRHVICARALTRNPDFDPDPLVDIPLRHAIEVVRRSRRLAHLPPELPEPVIGVKRKLPFDDVDDPPPPPLSPKPTKRPRLLSELDQPAAAPRRPSTPRPPSFAPPSFKFRTFVLAPPPAPSTSAATSRLIARTSPTSPLSTGPPAVLQSAPSPAADAAGTSPAPAAAGGPALRLPLPASVAPAPPPVTRRKSRSKRAKHAPAYKPLPSTPPPLIEYDYTILDFDKADITCSPSPRRSLPPPSPPPGPVPARPVAAQRPTHHRPDYYLQRAQDYRALLPLEQVRPAMALDSNDQPVLAVERLNRTVPGWRGAAPRPTIARVRAAWATPQLKDILQCLHIVPYLGRNTAISDMNGRTVFYRSTPFREHPGQDVVEQFAADSYRFAAASPITPGDRRHNARGQHYACILGVHRQYAKEAYYTRFHRRYLDNVAWYFREDGPASRLTKYLTTLIDTRFPAIAARMRANHAWHYQHTLASGTPLVPQFGLFWNFCINLPSPESGVPRVFCTPHSDAMNCAVLLCAVFVFWSKDWLAEEEWSWLVIWELGIVVECPRGCFLLYPSALFFHFNARIVKCPKGQKPTPTNSEELPKTDGFPLGARGSGVWFTQASMHSHTSERDGRGRLPDYEALARSCFPDMAPVVLSSSPTLDHLVDAFASAPFLSEL